jgi:uncharacterized phiE125 gp8 family phage protein
MSVDSTVALVDLPTVKDFLNLTGAADKDRALQDLINNVSSDCMKHCCRVFLTATYTNEKYDGHNDGTLILKNYPVTAVSELIPYEDATALDVDEDYVIWDAAAGIIKLLDGKTFPKTIMGIDVTYTAGYAFASLPYDLVQSVLEAIAFRFAERDTKRWGVDSQQMREQSTNYIRRPYTEHVYSVWNRYRSHNTGE